MPKSEVLDRADQIVADCDSPAGPLFTGGQYAEAEIVGTAVIETWGTCSSCTASRGHYCC